MQSSENISKIWAKTRKEIEVGKEEDFVKSQHQESPSVFMQCDVRIKIMDKKVFKCRR